MIVKPLQCNSTLKWAPVFTQPCNLIQFAYKEDLNGTGILQQFWKLALLGLKIRVSSNVLLLDEDVWNGCLASHLTESSLDSRSVIDLVELDGVVLGAHLAQQRLGGLAVRAVGLAEDSDGIVVNDALSLGLCRGHGGGVGSCGEETA